MSELNEEQVIRAEICRVAVHLGLERSPREPVDVVTEKLSIWVFQARALRPYRVAALRSLSEARLATLPDCYSLFRVLVDLADFIKHGHAEAPSSSAPEAA